LSALPEEFKNRPKAIPTPPDDDIEEIILEESKDDSGVSEDFGSIDLDEEKSEKEEGTEDLAKGSETEDEGIENPRGTEGTEVVEDLEDMERIEGTEDKQGTEVSEESEKTEESEDPEDPEGMEEDQTVEEEAEVAEQAPESKTNPDVESVIDDEIWDELPFCRASVSSAPKLISVQEYEEEESNPSDDSLPKSAISLKSKASMQIVRTPPTPHALTTPEYRELTPRPKSPGIMSTTNGTIKIEDLEENEVDVEIEIEQESPEMQIMHVQSEMLPRNESDMKMEDLESGLSIRDEDDQGSAQGDIEMGHQDVDAFVITKDALIEDRKPREVQEQPMLEPDYDFQDHIGPLALGCGKIVIVFGALLVATFSLF